MFPVTVIHEQAQRVGLDYLVIGGHAINCYGEPRATLDVDLLVRKADRAAWAKLLEGEGFRLQREHENFAQFSPPYGVAWRLDLMLVSSETFLKFLTESRSMSCLGVHTRVASPEHLIALKLHAMRYGPADRFEKDFGDLLNLARNTGLDVQSAIVQDLFARYGTPELYERFREKLQRPEG